MNLKVGLIGFCVLSLMGCQSSHSSKQIEDLYQEKDGIQTYSAAVEHFNDTVTYYRSEQVDINGNNMIIDFYKDGENNSIVTKAIYNDEGNHQLFYTIVDKNNFHTLYKNGDTYIYEVIDDYTDSVNDFYIDYSQSQDYQILNVDRKDEKNSIVLKMKMKEFMQYQVGDIDSESYTIRDLIIQNDGYITQEKITYYVDDSFDEILQEGSSIVNSQFNEKSLSDLRDEIELMKSCDGLSDEEVSQKLNVEL